MSVPSPRRVLLVDDDPSLIAALTDGLTLVGGYDVTPASDGAAGLQRILDVRPDCVVVDIRMPRLNGYFLVRALRGDPQTAQIPIVILSAMVREREQLAGYLSGADAYLVKPVTMTDLLTAIDNAIGLTEEERVQRLRMLASDTN